MDPDSALDNLTRMAQVIGRDQQLRRWFSALAQMPAVERRNEIYSASERMRAEGRTRIWLFRFDCSRIREYLTLLALPSKSMTRPSPDLGR